MPRLLADLSVARNDRIYDRLFRKIARANARLLMMFVQQDIDFVLF